MQHYRPFLIILLLTAAFSAFSAPLLAASNSPSHTQEILADAFHKALHTNPTILERQANEQAAWFDIREKRGRLLPSVDATYGIGQEKSRPPFLDYFRGNTQLRHIRLSQLIFDGRRTQNEIARSRAEYEAALNLTDEQINSIALQTVEVFLNILRNQARLSLAQKNVQSHLSTVGKMRTSFKGGAGRQSELSLAEGRLAQARVILETREGELENAHISYRKVVGNKPQHLSMPRVPYQQLPKTPAQALKAAYQHNPSIAASYKDLEASVRQIRINQSAFLPTINLELGAIRDTDLDGLRGVNINLQGLVVARYNILRGGSDKAAVQKAVREKYARSEAVEETYRIVEELLKQSWNDWKTAEDQVKQLYKYVTSSKKVVAAYQEEFKLGQRSLLNLLDVENELFNAKTALIDGKFREKFNVYRILASMGILADNLQPIASWPM